MTEKKFADELREVTKSAREERRRKEETREKRLRDDAPAVAQQVYEQVLRPALIEAANEGSHGYEWAPSGTQEAYAAELVAKLATDDGLEVEHQPGGTLEFTWKS
jgi:hypothetical protein